MKLISQRIRGMQDVILDEGQKYMYVCDVMMKRAELYGFKFARTPALEYTELFERSSGDGSDIVNKEMYTFEDRSGRSVSLRPEGTAGIMRAVLEGGVSSYNLPIKLMYVASCYRYEKPQSGRYREFFQFGLEMFGSSSILAEAEIIGLAKSILADLHINGIRLEINSIGCGECRKKYVEMLKSYFKSNESRLCKSCIEKLERNPLRILDCKDGSCREVCKDAPLITDNLCEKCSKNLADLRKYLDAGKIEYTVNPHIVRGLDYYTGIVFEFLADVGGNSLAVCGGGRYDKLSETLGGPFLPAVGLGFGIERVIIAMDSCSDKPFSVQKPFLYIASTCEESCIFAQKLCEVLRSVGIYAETDVCGRSLKAQMKYAGKIGARFSMVLGNEEIESTRAQLKDMVSGEQYRISLGKEFLPEIFKIQSFKTFD